MKEWKTKTKTGILQIKYAKQIYIQYSYINSIKCVCVLVCAAAYSYEKIHIFASLVILNLVWFSFRFSHFRYKNRRYVCNILRSVLCEKNRNIQTVYALVACFLLISFFLCVCVLIYKFFFCFYINFVYK